MPMHAIREQACTAVPIMVSSDDVHAQVRAGIEPLSPRGQEIDAPFGSAVKKITEHDQPWVSARMSARRAGHTMARSPDSSRSSPARSMRTCRSARAVLRRIRLRRTLELRGHARDPVAPGLR